MDSPQRKWKLSLLFVIIVLGFIILYKMLPYLSGFLGAFTIYILVRGQMQNLIQKRGFRNGFAAIIVLAEVVLCFIIPITLIVWMLLNQLQQINLDPQVLILGAENIVGVVKSKTGYNLLDFDNLAYFTNGASKLLQITLGGISSFSINAVIIVFVLYFLLIGGKKMEAYIIELLPFDKESKRDILKEVRTKIISNAIGIPLLASVQGIVAFVGYLLFGMPHAIFFAILTACATIMPVVGTTIVWLPASIYLAISGDWFSAIGLFVFGAIIIGGSDNLVRFLLQKRMADTHPLITIFGVIIGMSLFGFWGVIFGPLLLSMFCLCVDIYKREYLDTKS